MKGFKRLFCILLCALTCISASPFGIGVFAVECAHTYENVVENGSFAYYGCSKCGEVVDTKRKYTEEEKAYDVHYDLQLKR